MTYIFSPPDNKFFKWDGVIDVPVLVPSNNGVCTKAYVDKEVNDPDSVMVIETPYVIIVAMVENLNAYHGINGLVGKFQFTVDCGGIFTSVFGNDLMVKTELHEIF